MSRENIMNRYRSALINLIILLVAILAIYRTFPPSPLPVDAPAALFSAERALATVKAISGAPRLVGSPAYADAKSYVLAQMAELGLATEVQSTRLDGVAVENVLGRLDGSQATDAILLSAHLDSVANSPGATDDGSGVAAVLETVRALRSEGPLPNTVIVLFTGPEENCCYGADAFVRQHPWAKDVRLVVNVDAGGIGGPSILAATAPDAGWLIEQAAGVLPDPIGSSAIEAFGSPATDYTLLFRKAGWVGYDFNLSWRKRIHSGEDSLENVSLASLQHQGEHMLALARYFGSRPLSMPQSPRPIYFDLLGLTMLYYPQSWAKWIPLAVSIVLGGTVFLAFRRCLVTLKGIGSGALVFLLNLLTIPILLLLVEFLIIRPLLPAHPQLAADLTGDSFVSNAIRWGSLVLTLIATAAWYVWFAKRKNIDRIALYLGANLCLYAFAFATTFALPGASYLFVWPLLVSSAGMGLGFLSQKKGVRLFSFLLVFVSALVAVVLFVPGILIAVISIDIQMIFLVPVFVVSLLGFVFLI
jgi:hypothetical protein